MSKVVSGIGNAVTDVVKGAVKVVKSAGETIKNIASSPIGKALVIAAAIYFGGAAIAGGYGSSAAGGSFFSGMGSGISSAATSLQSAWSSAMAGNFAEAGSSIGSSWANAAGEGYVNAGGVLEKGVSLADTGALTTPPAAEPSAASNLVNGPGSTDQVARFTDAQLSPLEQTSQYSLNGPGVSNGGINPGGYSGSPGMSSGGYDLYKGASAGSTPSAWSSVWNSPYTAPALISGGMQVGGAIIQGKAQEEAMKEQREYEQRMADEARARYNTNVGTQLWDPNAQAPIYQNQNSAWDPYVEARARSAQYAPAPTGVAAKYMPYTA